MMKSSLKPMKLRYITLPLLAALATGFNLHGQSVGDARGPDNGQSSFYRPLTLAAAPGETAGGGGGGEGEESQEELAKASGLKADWSKATAKAAKFVATSTTNALIYASQFQV